MFGMIALIGIAFILWYVSKGLKWLSTFFTALSLELEDRHVYKSHVRRQDKIAVKPKEVPDVIYNRQVNSEIEKMLEEIEHPK
jgi:hypothetical protein